MGGWGSYYGGSLEFPLILGGDFKHVLFSLLFGKDVQFDEHIFADGLKPPTEKAWGNFCWIAPPLGNYSEIVELMSQIIFPS